MYLYKKQFLYGMWMQKKKNKQTWFEKIKIRWYQKQNKMERQTKI